MDYKKMYHELRDAAAEQEAAQELTGQQIQDIVNLNARYRRKEKEAAAAAQRRKRARRQARQQARAKAVSSAITAYALLGLFSVGVLGYLIGIGEGLRVLASLGIAGGILLAVLSVDKIIGKWHRRGRYERV